MWISNKGIPTMTSRRQMLRNASAGFGALALHGLLGLESRGAIHSQGPLSPKQPHFKPKAKRVIFLFMHGGPSHVDTFDYKPLLTRDDGKPPRLPMEIQAVWPKWPMGQRPFSPCGQAR